MKTSHGRFAIFTFILVLICLLLGDHFRQKNKLLRASTLGFQQAVEKEQFLQDQNLALKKRWTCDKDILAELSKYLILPQNEISNGTTEVYDPELQHNISVYESYLSGFIAYDDCVKVLERLCEARLPILITSLSIHRNIAHNYALQISMTYRTK